MTTAIDSVRSFNRFYTRFTGALDARFLGSDLSLVEARILWELANRTEPVAADVQAELSIDAGYLSRILRRFEGRGWISRERGADARRRPIALTGAGRMAFAALDRQQAQRVADGVAGLGARDQDILAGALATARAMLEARPAAYSVRTFGPGDMGMITARQAILYHEGWGWSRPMEALLSDVTARFLRAFKPGREQCWIAEVGGTMAGSVFVVDAGDGVAQLRLLYSEPWARGLGIGRDLVDRCVSFAREAGYDELMLWTHTVLTSARRIYDAAGFRITAVEMHDEFGMPEQGETWRLSLSDEPRPVTPPAD